MKSTGFGWEISNVNGNGADLYMPFTAAVTVCGIDLDVSFVTLTALTGMAEVLVNAALTSGTPQFVGGKAAYIGGPLLGSDALGGSTVYKGYSGLIIGGGKNGPGFLTSVILKTYCKQGGQDARHVSLTGLGIPVPAGSYLVLHMDHAGQPVDVEMQGVIFYQ